MSDFDWMKSPANLPRVGATAATREAEISRRAAIFAHLGYSQARAEARLKKNIEWEYERVGKPIILKRLSALVADAYKRAGVGRSKKR